MAHGNGNLPAARWPILLLIGLRGTRLYLSYTCWSRGYRLERSQYWVHHRPKPNLVSGKLWKDTGKLM